MGGFWACFGGSFGAKTGQLRGEKMGKNNEKMENFHFPFPQLSFPFAAKLCRPIFMANFHRQSLGVERVVIKSS